MIGHIVAAFLKLLLQDTTGNVNLPVLRLSFFFVFFSIICLLFRFV